MDIWALRHGQSEYNLLGLCNDDPGKNVSLTDEGRRQASRAAARLAGVAFDAAFVSPLPRARQTAEIVLADRDVPVTVEPSISDIRSGFEGKPVSEYFTATAGDPLHARVNGGESLVDYRNRVERFMGCLRRRAYGAVLLIAHEETLRVIKAYGEGLPDERLRDLHFGNCEPFHCRFAREAGTAFPLRVEALSHPIFRRVR